MNESDRSPATVYDYLAVILQQLAEISWQKLGLQTDMVTGKLEPDLAQAKVAIDLVAHIASVIEPQLDGSDQRTLQNTVRDLRVNYVQRSKDTETKT